MKPFKKKIKFVVVLEAFFFKVLRYNTEHFSNVLLVLYELYYLFRKGDIMNYLTDSLIQRLLSSGKW